MNGIGSRLLEFHRGLRVKYGVSNPIVCLILKDKVFQAIVSQTFLVDEITNSREMMVNILRENEFMWFGVKIQSDKKHLQTSKE